MNERNYKSGEEIGVKHAAEGVAVIDAAAVNSAQARELYKKREPIYPKLVHGQFRALKWGLLFATLGVYYLLPWLRWPRGPRELRVSAVATHLGVLYCIYRTTAVYTGAYNIQVYNTATS